MTSPGAEKKSKAIPLETYQEYLEAKRVVDLRCLNRRVYNAFRARVETFRDPFLLDLGTGTGLMIRKLLGLRPQGDTLIYGIDLDERNCSAALRLIVRALVRSGYHVHVRGRDGPEEGTAMGIVASLQGRRIRVEIRNADVLEPEASWLPGDGAFDAVTANAFMDLVPLEETVQRINCFLKPQGLFYATINYDGVTTLLPPFRDREFERDLLDNYNFAMDRRRVHGMATGGSRSGSRLFGVLSERGFRIVELGSSDWTVGPKAGEYERLEKSFVRAILQMIYEEGIANGMQHSGRLESWRAERLDALERGELSFMNHQIDLLAQKEPGIEDHARD